MNDVELKIEAETVVGPFTKTINIKTADTCTFNTVYIHSL